MQVANQVAAEVVALDLPATVRLARTTALGVMIAGSLTVALLAFRPESIWTLRRGHLQDVNARHWRDALRLGLPSVLLVATVLAAVATLELATVAAAAEPYFIDSSPEDGAHLDVPPAEVVLTFGAGLSEDSSFDVRLEFGGEIVGHGELDPSVAARTVLRGDVHITAPGFYKVVYSVRVNASNWRFGAIRFTVSQTPGGAFHVDLASTGAGDPDGFGSARIRIRDHGSWVAICGHLTVENLSQVTGFDLHLGDEGEVGEVIWAPLLGDGCIMPPISAFPEMYAVLADPTAYYVDVHTEDYPDGAIRGQLMADAPDTALEPPTTSPWVGMGFLLVASGGLVRLADRLRERRGVASG